MFTMFLSRSEYDQGVNTFSPEGRLFQVEYAMEAIKLGTTAVGIQTAGGVVLAVEKRLASKLIEPTSIEKIWEIDSHLGCAVSGLTADARQLVDHARIEAQNHRFTYNEPMKCQSVVQAVCDLKISFGEGDENSPSRPFGVALLMAGVDKDGTPSLFSTDPSGTYLQYDAKSIGSGAEGAETILKEVYHKSLTFEEARKMAVSILKQSMEEKISGSNVEVAVVTKEGGFQLLSSPEVEGLITAANDAPSVAA